MARVKQVFTIYILYTPICQVFNDQTTAQLKTGIFSLILSKTKDRKTSITNWKEAYTDISFFLYA